MNADDRRKLRNRKRRIERRLEPRQWREQPEPMFRASNLRYEMAERTRAVSVGGIGAIHVLLSRIGFIRAIDEGLQLLKRHLPYHESDHVLNIAYNILAGHTRLEDIEILRNDECYTDLLGAQRIPDPTTAGDFLRRFKPPKVENLMELTNRFRPQFWDRQPAEFRRLGIVDVDGSHVLTVGEKKEGMDVTYKGVWGYHPLIVSLANTGEPLFLVNRSGNRPSHEGAAERIDQAIALVSHSFEKLLVRGDSDFSLTWKFDEWTSAEVGFVFGYDAKANLVRLADSLPTNAWRPFVRRPQPTIQTAPRAVRPNVKEAIVREREYDNIRLRSEDIAEFRYRPGACQREYRMVVIRKNLSIEKGERRLFDQIRYFFYVTNLEDVSAEDVVAYSHDRCGDQENLIQQLKNGISALRCPVHDLVSNWAYMVIAALAWTFKAWFGLTLAANERDQILAMEAKTFFYAVIRIPCQVIHAARRIILRVLAYTRHARLLFRILDVTARLRFT